MNSVSLLTRMVRLNECSVSGNGTIYDLAQVQNSLNVMAQGNICVLSQMLWVRYSPEYLETDTGTVSVS